MAFAQSLWLTGFPDDLDASLANRLASYFSVPSEALLWGETAIKSVTGSSSRDATLPPVARESMVGKHPMAPARFPSYYPCMTPTYAEPLNGIAISPN